MAVDTSFETFLRVTGKKNYIRTGFFKRKRTKTIQNASSFERIEYFQWKQKKEKEETQRLQNEYPKFEDILNDLLKSVDRPEYKSDNVDYKKRIEEEQLPYFDDTQRYKDLPLNKRYPTLVENVTSVVSNYSSNFKDPENYAGVKSEASPEGSYNSSWVERHIKWMITPDGTEPNLREINAMGKWTFVGDFEVISKGGGGGSITPEITKPATEKPTPRPPKLEVELPKPNVVTPRGFGGENEMGNPRLGSYTPRGGVLGGSNYSNPYDAVENEFRYRDKKTQQER